MNTTAAIEASQPRISQHLTLTGREYLRVSQDRSGQKRSVTEQHGENKEIAAEHGITISGEPYTDNDLSASRYARKQREDFGRLMNDLKSDLFGAQILVLWEASRGSRQMTEWVQLIEVCAEKRVRIFVTSHERLYDPRNGRDRSVLYDEANKGEYSSFETSERIKRTARRLARVGRPYGPAPYGFRPVYDQATGDLVNWVEDRPAARVPKILFHALVRGISFKRIERYLAKRGYLTHRGRPFTHQRLLGMAKTYAYAGLRVHIPNEIDGEPVRRRGVKNPQITGAIWEPLVSPEVFWKVQKILADPARRTYRHGRAVHVLTSVIRCDVCAGPLRVKRPDMPDAVYVCLRRQCVQISKAAVDAVLIGDVHNPGALLRYLASDAIYRDFAAPPTDDARDARVRAQLAELRAEKAVCESTQTKTAAEALMIAKTLDGITADIAALEARQQAAAMPSTIRSLVAPGQDIAERWARIELTARREAARLIFSPAALGEVRIRRREGKSGVLHRISYTTTPDTNPEPAPPT
ncbi:recombinase family protein [Streptomyces sp. MP131-18]|uniref:recombinase family protein n=1 Tax=Streptomyces sp. MP131-18 TaxID=1857892 RepID=UPI00097C0866|nr:recombinase family protein [Streptomyces sp. MP131-18]ONK12247.1 hypothetical protein STBA_29870 [Streptomyces sp. MP131-18]